MEIKLFYTRGKIKYLFYRIKYKIDFFKRTIEILLKINNIKYVQIYLSQSTKKIIIAPMSETLYGLKYEQEFCFLYDFDIDNKILGKETLDKLNLYSYKNKEFVNYKKSDWPAYKYSKLKSIKTFENKYISIIIKLYKYQTIEIENSMKGIHLKINLSLSSLEKDAEIGNKIKEVYYKSM
jgi:hypothetical protein